MYETSTELVGTLLENAVATLDIPPAQREAATREYLRVGNWLASGSDAGTGWVVYPQGSFLLNTVVLPEGADEYDVDTVCQREVRKDTMTQKQLKDEVGDVLDGYVGAHADLADGPLRLKEGRRCWTLRYPATLRFHLDVLPAIPNPDRPPGGILITDRELHLWQSSNPRAFAAWFKQQAHTEFVEKRLLLAEAARTAPEAIPDWEVKTTLHLLVQVLKLHRNRHFAEDLDSRPPSILISTLAGLAYRGERDLYEAVRRAVREMPTFIHQTDHGIWVPNPVEPRENFAERWQNHPSLQAKFATWLERLEDDLLGAESERGLHKVALRLSESFGEGPVNKAMIQLSDSYRETRERGALGFSSTSGLLSTSGAIAVRRHDFYGDPSA